jgi:hypothetical protein
MGSVYLFRAALYGLMLVLDKDALSYYMSYYKILTFSIAIRKSKLIFLMSKNQLEDFI